MLRLSTKQDFEALLLGAAIYATGGGGDIEEGMKLVKEAFLDKSKVLEIKDFEELDQEKFVATPYDVGTIAPSATLRKPLKIANTILRAVERFKELLGIELVAFMPVELGGGNTAVALYASGIAGIPVADGDRVGRAAPEIHQDTAFLFNKSTLPAYAVTPTGDEVLIVGYADVDDYEAMLRHLAVLSGKFVTVIDTPLKVSEAKDIAIRGSLTRCYELGKLVLDMKSRNAIKIDRIAEAMNGWVVFHGIIKEWRWRNEGGFLVGEMIIEGIEEYKNRVLRSWIKNEHIMVWIDNEPLVMPPDLFTLVLRDGTPLLNSKAREGIEVYGIAAPAPNVWRSERGLELFGPKHFGFNYEYVPVEILIRKRGVVA